MALMTCNVNERQHVYEGGLQLWYQMITPIWAMLTGSSLAHARDHLCAVHRTSAPLFSHETLGLVFLAFPSIEMSGRKFFVGELQRPPSSHGLQTVWQKQGC